MGILHQAITNKNYRGISEDELAEYRDEERLYSKSWNKNMRHQLIGKSEAFCPTCQSFTTNYNNQGECSECGTEVREGVEEE